jgi:hypothetical protein
MIIPTSAVKTASAITRGFINATKSGNRVSQREREGNGRRRIVIAVVFMVSSLNANDLAFARSTTFRTAYEEVHQENLAA